MRILFFAYRYWPIAGGVEKYVHQLAKALLAMGHEVDVVTGAAQAGLATREMHEGVRIHRFPVLGSPLRVRAWLWRRIGLFRRADVIHVSNTHMLEHFWNVFGGLIDRRKVFLTRHGMSYIYPVPDWERRRAVRSLKLAAGVVHDGAFIEKWLHVKPDLCPDQGLFPPADEMPPVPEPPPDSATFVGRLEPDSGVQIYLDGLRMLTSVQEQPFMLDAYGDGSLAAELRRRAERESLPVRFCGSTPDAQRHITDSCFAFIDGRMAIQEAMARRRLVFAAFVDPLKRDYVSTEAFSPYLIPCGSGADLAKHVAYYAEHPWERAVLVERAYQHARMLTWRRTAEAYLGFWKERLAVPQPVRSKREVMQIVGDIRRESGRPKTDWASAWPAPDLASSVPDAPVC